MIEETIVIVENKLKEMGYLCEKQIAITGLHPLLYAHSPATYKLGFAKVQDYFLFIDWQYSALSKIDMLVEIHKKFSKYVNQFFKVPHSLRMTLPNLAIIAVSEQPFTQEAVNYVNYTYMIPWTGGEAGQFMLVDLEKKVLHVHVEPRMSRQTGSLPLEHSVQLMRNILNPVSFRPAKKSDCLY